MVIKLVPLGGGLYRLLLGKVLPEVGIPLAFRQLLVEGIQPSAYVFNSLKKPETIMFFTAPPHAAVENLLVPSGVISRKFGNGVVEVQLDSKTLGLGLRDFCLENEQAIITGCVYSQPQVLLADKNMSACLLIETAEFEPIAVDGFDPGTDITDYGWGVVGLRVPKGEHPGQLVAAFRGLQPDSQIELFAFEPSAFEIGPAAATGTVFLFINPLTPILPVKNITIGSRGGGVVALDTQEGAGGRPNTGEMLAAAREFFLRNHQRIGAVSLEIAINPTRIVAYAFVETTAARALSRR